MNQLRFVLDQLKIRYDPIGNRGAAHLRDSENLLKIRDGDDARNDRDRYSPITHMFLKAVEIGILEE